MNRYKNFIFLMALVSVGSPCFSAEKMESGGVPSTKGYTLSDIIDQTIKSNVDVHLAAAKTDEEKAKSLQSASSLLPQLLGTVSQSRVFKENLEAMGFEPSPGLETLLGPFNVFDARLLLVQKVFDLNDYWKFKEDSSNVEAFKWQEELTKEQVATAASLAYLEVIRARRSVTTTQMDLSLAQSLFDLATDQRNAGLATGVDVARAKTRQEEAHLRLIKARTQEHQASLRLARVAGLSFDDPLNLIDPLTYSTATTKTILDALPQAETDRREMKIADTYVVSKTNALKSARGGHWPSVVATGDYGLSGNNPSNSEKTGSIGARLNVPLFTGRNTEGEVKAAEAKMVQVQEKRADILRQIEEDVRMSLDTLASEIEEVESASQTVALSEQEMQMAKDRYSAGVGDNIQVIAAQTALAQAHENQTNALARYHASRLNYEMSIGHAQEFKLN